jgi:hypothetical protein
MLPLKLRVEVLRATGLAPADLNGRSDPYCIVTVGENMIRTSVQLETLSPEWMESMVFFSNDLEPYALVQEACDGDDPIIRIVLLGYLVIKVWDRDLGNPDDFLGQVIIPLSSLPLCPSHLAEVSQEKWYNLTRQSTKNEMSRGKLQLKMQLEAIEENVMLINDELDCNLFTITKAIGFQIPVKFNSQITEYPGNDSNAYISLQVNFQDQQRRWNLLFSKFTWISRDAIPKPWYS